MAGRGASRPAGLASHICQPPLGLMTWPVRKPASSPARDPSSPPTDVSTTAFTVAHLTTWSFGSPIRSDQPPRLREVGKPKKTLIRDSAYPSQLPAQSH